ncbi:MAG: PaaI family thioesterase, partial [Microvirga sp.]
MEQVHGVVERDVLVAEPGLLFLRGMITGRHPAPPFSKTTGIYLVEAEENRVVFRGRPGSEFFNPIGTIHGGWTSAILDSAMACAVHTTLLAGQGYTSVEMKLNFVRPILPDLGEVTCEG